MRRLATTLLILAATMAFAACGATDDGGSTPPDATAPTAAASDGGSTAACEVAAGAGDVAGTIADNAFDPADVTASAGQVVAFDPQTRTVTFSVGDRRFDYRLPPAGE